MMINSYHPSLSGTTPGLTGKPTLPDKAIFKLDRLQDTTVQTQPKNMAGSPPDPLDSSQPVSQERMPHWLFLEETVATGTLNKTVSIEDSARLSNNVLKDVSRQMEAAFSAAGITNVPPVSINFDSTGKVIVGKHPQQEEIQELFSKDETLSYNLHNALRYKEHTMSLESGAIFQQAYGKAYDTLGQAAAEALFERYINMGEPKASLVFGEAGLETLFAGKSDRDYLAGISSELNLG